MPLTLTRAATVLSLTQLSEGEPKGSPAKGQLSNPDCPVSSIAAGASLLPLYTFPAADGFAAKRVRSFGSIADLATGGGAAVPDAYDDLASAGSSDEDAALGSENSFDGGSAAQVVPQRSVLDALLLGEWEDRAEAGLFRYDVTACPTKLIPGTYGFVAQCNEGRASKKRPTEFRIDQVAQPFDAGKFNFTKALQKEVLLMFEPSAPSRHHRAANKPSFSPAVVPRASPNLVFINVSPIEYGHVLLVPRALDGLQQLITPDTLLLALQFAKEADNPYFRLAFNSLGAYGTINHLHFQAYYLAAPFAIERAPTAPLALPGQEGCKAKRCPGRVRVERLLEYPVRTLVFEAGDSLAELAQLVGTACQRLTAANVPHNMFIADSGARVFLYPNAFAERKARGQIPEEVLETQVDPAAFEIAGQIVLKRREDYEAVSQESAWRLLELSSLDEARFLEAAELALEGLL
ncbi:GDP-L-galactose phosphorylase 1 [Micractinium conductrix]|uniref:GDP-D-glucose phosphorylase 1 n=1 Tax=Micractinium conductrix TaxID=554055 RepID=A0A2P6V6P3_9CHLO|nr:GDP-L-galactose phosphorylase 1 [Micractinium conductrix]|eukprot:PSC69751.1 GDP-L-galactose phosphorylase 1 [Micractinium conductrix]